MPCPPRPWNLIRNISWSHRAGQKIDQRRSAIARRTRSSARAIAAARGAVPSAVERSSTARVLKRIFSAMVSSAVDSLPLAYSTAAQITPPALAMKSGRLTTPFSYSTASASLVIGILAPCATRRVFSLSTFSSVMTSGRAAGIQMSQATSMIASPSAASPPARSVTGPP
jgi:hypothetical protein